MNLIVPNDDAKWSTNSPFHIRAVTNGKGGLGRRIHAGHGDDIIHRVDALAVGAECDDILMEVTDSIGEEIHKLCDLCV